MNVPTTTDLRRELEELRRYVDQVERDLNSRIAALERKQASDNDDLRRELADVKKEMAELKRQIADVASGQTANHIGVLHVLSVVMRYVQVPDKEIRKAMVTAGGGHG